MSFNLERIPEKKKIKNPNWFYTFKKFPKRERIKNPMSFVFLRISRKGKIFKNTMSFILLKSPLKRKGFKKSHWFYFYIWKFFFIGGSLVMKKFKAMNIFSNGSRVYLQGGQQWQSQEFVIRGKSKNKIIIFLSQKII